MEKIRRNKSDCGILIPAILIYLCFELIPVVMSIYFSFNDWYGIQAVALKFVGLKNYRNIFHNAVFLKSLQNVLIYVVISVVLQVPLGFGLESLIHHFKRGQRFFKAAFFIPMILSVTAVALLWNFIYFPNEKGILNSLLIKIGLFKLYAAMACKSENITDVLDYCKHMDKCWLLYDYLFSRTYLDSKLSFGSW